MAENETLDLKKSPRWQIICRLIEQDAATDEILDAAKHCSIKTVQKLSQLIPFVEMLTVTERQDKHRLQHER